jgi:hypothetical protein
MLHRAGVHPAHRQVQVDSAEDLDSWHFFPNNVSERSGRLIVILQKQSAHPAALCKPGKVDRISRSCRAIWSCVGVNIEGARHGILLANTAEAAQNINPRKTAFTITRVSPVNGTLYPVVFRKYCRSKYDAVARNFT